MHNDVVNDVSYAGLVMRGDILGLERRRRWGDEEKLEIVLSVGVGGATVTQVAQRHDVTRQQIYAWRHELKSKRCDGPVVPGRRSFGHAALQLSLQEFGNGAPK